MLRIKGLTKRYRTGDLALKGVDLVVPDGQVMQSSPAQSTESASLAVYRLRDDLVRTCSPVGDHEFMRRSRSSR